MTDDTYSAEHVTLGVNFCDPDDPASDMTIDLYDHRIGDGVFLTPVLRRSPGAEARATRQVAVLQPYTEALFYAWVAGGDAGAEKLAANLLEFAGVGVA